MKKLLFFVFLLPMIALGQQISSVKLHTHENYTEYFREAYQQNPAIPLGTLEAVAYSNTHICHITHTAGEMGSCMGLPMVYGVMGLTLDGKGYFNNNLTYVSDLSGFSIDEIIAEPEKNILAYAKAFSMIMATLESQRTEETKDDEIIFNTLIALSELPHEDEGQLYALNLQLYSYFWFMGRPEFQMIYNFPNNNFDLQTLFGEENYRVLSSEHVIFSEESITDGNGNIYKASGNNAPSVQSADYAPAIWNPAASCNYSSRSQSISAVTIHDVEGSYASCISWFQNCSAGVSAHYVVRSSDGQITQMVLESKKAWHVGSENGYTIGIEHEGYQAQTGWYTTAMYQSSANLVKDICNSGYNINPATCWNGPSCNGICTKPSTYKIKGHQMYPNQTHNDPGPHWDWNTYYNYINNTSTACGTPTGLSAASVTTNSATLNWTAVSGATNYNIIYTSSSGSITTTSNTNSVSITALTPSTTYQFKVQAVCSSAGNFSSLVSFTTAASILTNDNCSNAVTLFPNPTCNQITGDVAGATASGLTRASCDVFGGTPKLYDVWYQFQATSASHTIKIVPSSSLDAVLALYTSCSGGQIGCSDNGGGPGAAESISASTLTVGNTYYIRVYSYGAIIPSTTTFNICVTGPTSPLCGTPAGLSTSAITTSGATLSWNNVSGATSYNVQYKPSSSSAWTSVATSATTTSLNGLAAGTSYQFKVQAICSSAGSFSSPASFTTIASSSSSDSTFTIGTSTSPYSAHPYGTVYMDERVQYIIPKSDLVNAGWTSATPYLKSISFYISSVSPQPMGSFTIKMAHITGTSFASTSFLSGTNSTVVYSGTVTATQGWNTYTFSTPFQYNGVSSLLVSICWDNDDFTVNSAVYATSYSNYVALYYRQDLANGGMCSKTTGTRSYYRPNAKLRFSSTTELSNWQGMPMQNSSNFSAGGTRTFEIFPNPLSGNVLSGIVNDIEDQLMVIKIYDLLGREVFSQAVPVAGGSFSVTLDGDNFKTGVYTLVGLTDTERFTRKLVVK